MSVSPITFLCANVGPHHLPPFPTRRSSDLQTCTATVTVEDKVKPVAVCQDITVQLDATGNASITATQINNGSSDACGRAAEHTTQLKSTYDIVCPNLVTLTETDVNGNAQTC